MGTADFEKVKKPLTTRSFLTALSEVTMIPRTRSGLREKKAEQMLNLMEALKDNDDINNVYATSTFRMRSSRLCTDDCSGR